MMDTSKTTQKVHISDSLKKVNALHKQKLGIFGPYIGMSLILAFAFALLPLYFFLVFFNRVYFWVRGHQLIDPKPYFNFDRHGLPHLSVADKVWCEYCEWANGAIQWALAITNEIERRYCPIKNYCNAREQEAKLWREDFLEYDHKPEDIDQYYQTTYIQNTKFSKKSKSKEKVLKNNSVPSVESR